MSSYPPSGQTLHTSRETPSSAPFAESGSLQPDAEHVGRDGFGEAMSQLSRDVASLKDTLTTLVSQAGGEAAKAVRNMTQTAAGQVGDAASGVMGTGSDLAVSAKEHVKTFASELETVARRNPLGTIACTLLVGVVIGMMSRGR